MWIKSRGFSDRELDRFRELQRLSFALLQEEARQLEPGMTEQEVGRRLVKSYRAAGARSFFHLPVVLFGERTALPGEWSLGKFFPRKRAAAANDAVILDAAPIFDGFLVDTSFSFCLGQSAAHRAMMQHLGGFRAGVLDAVNAGVSFSVIAEGVNASIASQGYEPVHGKHPGAVLGHRTVRLPRLPFTLRRQGFDMPSLAWFKAKDWLAQAGLARSPLWNTSPASAHKPFDGLWLVEPHAGQGATGAKWEEILVIENGRARWLDDNPPHVEQWKRIEAGADYAPRALTGS